MITKLHQNMTRYGTCSTSPQGTALKPDPTYKGPERPYTGRWPAMDVFFKEETEKMMMRFREFPVDVQSTGMFFCLLGR